MLGVKIDDFDERGPWCTTEEVECLDACEVKLMCIIDEGGGVEPKPDKITDEMRYPNE